jgi:hypothetical protein
MVVLDVMARRAWLVSSGAVALLLFTVSVPRAALAGDGGPPAGDAGDKVAARAFREGETAFQKHDFARAAEAFESAYQTRPHPAPLWNAARAWHRAGSLARAANLYARYLREAPSDAKDRGAATTALVTLRASIAQLDIRAPGVDEVLVDDAHVEPPIVYVSPGKHVIRGRAGDHDRERSVIAQAGEVIGVALVDDPAPAAPKEALAPRSAGWSPAVVVALGGIDLVGVGVTIWSGLDTLGTRRDFDRVPSQENLDQGRAKQTRTNVALGITAGLAALTVVTAIWIVDWHRPSGTTSVAVGPGGASVGGSF